MTTSACGGSACIAGVSRDCGDSVFRLEGGATRSQSRRATNCATPGYGAPYAFLAVGFTIITQNWEVRKSILPQNYLLNLKCWVNFAIIIGESAKVHQLKTKKGEIIMLSGILEHVAKILGWTNDGYEQNIILAVAQWMGNKGL